MSCMKYRWLAVCIVLVLVCFSWMGFVMLLFTGVWLRQIALVGLLPLYLATRFYGNIKDD